MTDDLPNPKTVTAKDTKTETENYAIRDNIRRQEELQERIDRNKRAMSDNEDVIRATERESRLKAQQGYYRDSTGRFIAMENAKNARVRSARKRSSLVQGSGSDHKYRVAVTEADIRRQQIKHKINKFDKATNNGGFKVKPFESNLRFRSMDHMSVPRVKTMKMNVNMTTKGFSNKMNSIDRSLKNFSFSSPMKKSQYKRYRRNKKNKRKGGRRR